MKNKILIVDDAEINRSLLADILSVEYDIMEASNGVEAVSLLNQYHADLSLILLDIVMPEMDGWIRGSGDYEQKRMDSEHSGHYHFGGDVLQLY